MLVTKGVKVHGDTHRVLKKLKGQERAKSIDEVIRGLVRVSTGRTVEQHLASDKNLKLTTYLQGDGTKQK